MQRLNLLLIAGIVLAVALSAPVEANETKTSSKGVIMVSVIAKSPVSDYAMREFPESLFHQLSI